MKASLLSILINNSDLQFIIIHASPADPRIDKLPNLPARGPPRGRAAQPRLSLNQLPVEPRLLLRVRVGVAQAA